jgi:putative colanic acid biosynthesis UDP-glucose lipid carrier transferase
MPPTACVSSNPGAAAVGLATPALHWLAVYSGRNALRRWARCRTEPPQRGDHRRRRLSAKLANALVSPVDRGIDVLGFFDDRDGDRVHVDVAARRLGALRDAAPWMRQHGVHEVYITLPLGSQPRIVDLLEQLQGTTASVFFVPDVFGISIIQGRLQDMNGVPVVGLCETPFTGTNRLVKRLSDIVLSLPILLLSPLLLLPWPSASSSARPGR